VLAAIHGDLEWPEPDADGNHGFPSDITHFVWDAEQQLKDVPLWDGKARRDPNRITADTLLHCNGVALAASLTLSVSGAPSGYNLGELS
jgi:hypothetical protein